VRTDRFKLIANLLPDTLNPDYADTIRKLETAAKKHGETDCDDYIPKAIADAAPEVRTAYAVMEKPPRYELYDLQADPHEFHNLAADPALAATLTELQTQLTAWREQTQDPLLDPQNLARLTTEVTAINSKANGKQRPWGYPDYFFGKEPTTPSQPSKKKKKKP
jgi:hypothetical protein